METTLEKEWSRGQRLQKIFGRMLAGMTRQIGICGIKLPLGGKLAEIFDF